MDCRDILDAVYVHTKDTYIAKFYTSEVKSKTLSENQDLNENLKKTVLEDPRSETNTNFQESNTDVSETVKSSVAVPSFGRESRTSKDGFCRIRLYRRTPIS